MEATNPKDIRVIKLNWDNLTVTENLRWLPFNFPHAEWHIYWSGENRFRQEVNCEPTRLCENHFSAITAEEGRISTI